MNKLSKMTYNDLLDEIGKLEARKENIENQIYAIGLEMKKRRGRLEQSTV